MTNINVRMCMGCKERKSKQEFLRIIKVEDNLLVDLSQKQNTRGYYLCPNKNCYNKALKNKSFNKILKKNVIENELYDILENIK